LVAGAAWSLTQTVNTVTALQTTAGQLLTFVVRLCNIDTVSRSTTVSFLLDATYYSGIAVSSVTSPTTYSTSTGIWTVNSAPASACYTLTVTATILSSAAGSLVTNKAYVIFSDPGVDPIQASTTVSVPTAGWTAVPTAYSITTPEDTTYIATSPMLAFITSIAKSATIPVIETPPSHGTVTINSDYTFVYVPTANYFGADSFVYKICLVLNNNDCGRIALGSPTPATATVSITVSAVADNPVGLADTATTPEDTPIVIDVLANDDDLDLLALSQGDIVTPPFTLTISSPPSHGSAVVTVVGTVSKVTYTPNLNYNGPDSFSYQACAGARCTGSTGVSVTVTPLTDVPTTVNDQASTSQGFSLGVDVWANDVNYDTTDGKFSTTIWIPVITSSPTKGTLSVSSTTGIVTYVPNSGASGLDSFGYKLCLVADLSFCSLPATVAVTITTYVAVDDTYDQSTTFLWYAQNSGTKTVSVLLTNDNLNGLALANANLRIHTTASHGTLVVDPGNNKQLLYTPVSTYFGVDTWVYQFCEYVCEFF
jgi:hypothetical protein